VYFFARVSPTFPTAYPAATATPIIATSGAASGKSAAAIPPPIARPKIPPAAVIASFTCEEIFLPVLHQCAKCSQLLPRKL
jgi:hypothetical protein